VGTDNRKCSEITCGLCTSWVLIHGSVLLKMFKAPNGLLCADVPLRNYSLTHSKPGLCGPANGHIIRLRPHNCHIIHPQAQSASLESPVMILPGVSVADMAKKRKDDGFSQCSGLNDNLHTWVVSVLVLYVRDTEIKELRWWSAKMNQIFVFVLFQFYFSCCRQLKRKPVTHSCNARLVELKTLLFNFVVTVTCDVVIASFGLDSIMCIF